MLSSKFALICCLVFLFSQASAQIEGTLKVDKGYTYYRTFGSGLPILIINGGPGMNSNGFAGVAQKLATNNLTIIYDQRGTGRSTLEKTDSTTITMQLMADDIERLRQHLKIDKWIVLGHSFGGMLAAYYASYYPEHTYGLILSSSGGIDMGLMSYAGNISKRLNKNDADSFKYWSRKISKGDTTHYAALQRGKHLAPAYLYNKKNVPVIAERLTQGNAVINQLVWNDLQKIGFNCAPMLSSYKKPVLIIQGKQDIITLKTAETEHRVLKNSKIVLVDKCAHYGWLDNPKVYFAALEQFIRPIRMSKSKDK